MNKVGCNDLIAVDEIQSNKPTIARVDIVPETSSQHIGAATRKYVVMVKVQGKSSALMPAAGISY